MGGHAAGPLGTHRISAILVQFGRINAAQAQFFIPNRKTVTIGGANRLLRRPGDGFARPRCPAIQPGPKDQPGKDYSKHKRLQQRPPALPPRIFVFGKINAAIDSGYFRLPNDGNVFNI